MSILRIHNYKSILLIYIMSQNSLLTMKPLSRKQKSSTTTISIKPHQEKYVKITMGLLALSIGIIVIFAAVIGVSAYTIVQTTKPAVRSLTSGKINDAIGEAHAMLKSARHVTDNLPMGKIVNHWGNTNEILKNSKIPWDELPHWRQLTENTFRVTVNMLKEHPEWARELKESSSNLKDATHPIASESKEWRNSLRGATNAYVQTLLNMYKNTEE